MDFKKLNEYLEESMEYKEIKEHAIELPEIYLNDRDIEDTMWFLDIGSVYNSMCENNPYIMDMDYIVNRFVKRRKIDIIPYEYTGKCRDFHVPLDGHLYAKGFVGCRFGYTGTIKDLPVYAHVMGHLFEHVLMSRKVRLSKTYSDELILQNVLPLVMEKMILEEYGNEKLSNYYKKFRAARFKKMCLVDDMLRESSTEISHEMLVDSLDYDVSITYEDVEDYCAEIEYGNDPVYKAYCYYVADMLASKMFDRKNLKKDIGALLKVKSVEEFDAVLEPKIKR